MHDVADFSCADVTFGLGGCFCSGLCEAQTAEAYGVDRAFLSGGH